MAFSKRQLLILAGVAGVIAVLVVAIVLGRRGGGGGKSSLTVWGVFDNADAYGEIFRAFKRDTGISVAFVQKDISTYETELVDALAAGRGPDVFMMNNAWLAKHAEKLVPAPAAVIAPAEVRDLYPDVVSEDFVGGNRVWALPLFVDTLALFYNRDLFDQAAIAFPPQTWEELVALVPKLTRIGAGGVIEQSAIAMGTAFNINRASDILAALMLQAGTPIVDRKNLEAVFQRAGGTDVRSAGVAALEFYLQFANPAKSVYTWNAEQHYSIDAFSEGTLAMMLSYAFQIPTIRQKGPFVDFGVSPLPQPASRKDRVDYANYWGFAVSRQSRNAAAAWQLVAFMTSRESAQSYFRATGRPPARRDLIANVANQPIVGVFAKQALTAHSWFQASSSENENIFLGAIESVRRGQVSAETAISRAADQMNLLLAKFRR
jgi:multiple sugar transport system substrate-binding protein